MCQHFKGHQKILGLAFGIFVLFLFCVPRASAFEETWDSMVVEKRYVKIEANETVAFVKRNTDGTLKIEDYICWLSYEQQTAPPSDTLNPWVESISARSYNGGSFALVYGGMPIWEQGYKDHDPCISGFGKRNYRNVLASNTVTDQTFISQKFMPSQFYIQNISTNPVVITIYMPADYNDWIAESYGNTPPWRVYRSETATASFTNASDFLTLRGTYRYGSSWSDFADVASGATGSYSVSSSYTYALVPNTPYSSEVWTSDGLAPDNKFTSLDKPAPESWLEQLADATLGGLKNLLSYLFVPPEGYIQYKTDSINTSYSAKTGWVTTIKNSLTSATSPISESSWQGIPVHIFNHDVNLVDYQTLNNSIMPTLRLMMAASMFFITALLIYKDAHHLFRT